jgi:hypothetical protein
MRTRSLVILIILACVGVLTALAVGGGVLLYLAFKNVDADLSPRIDAMFAAIEDGRFGETYFTDTAPELRAAQTRAEYEQVGRLVKERLGTLRSKTLTLWNVQYFNAEGHADVAYSASFAKGQGTIRAQFKRTGGEWKLLNFRVDSPEFQKDLVSETCPHCGKLHPVAAKFCPNCGTPLPDGDAGKTPLAITGGSSSKTKDP